MTENPFDRPGSGTGDTFEPAQFMGALVIVYPKSYNPNDSTKHGPTTSADVDLVVVDRVDPQTNQPVVKRNARLFGNLANSVRDSLGRQVLGRVGQVPTNKGNPAWALMDPTDADAAQAAPAHQAWQAGQFAPPAVQPGQQQPPAQQQYNPPPQNPGHDPWAGVNAQPAPPAQQQWGTPPPQQQYGAPPGPPAQYGQPAATAAPQGAPGAPAAAQDDPNIGLLISKGLPEAQVRAMDPATRAAVAATY